MENVFPQASGSQAEALIFRYVPRPGLLKLCIINFLLGLVTLGFYRFWARTNVRRHIWSCTHINGEPLEYTGTGWELFMGFIMVMLFFGLPVAVVYAIIALSQGPESPLLVMLQGIVAFIIYVLWGFAIYRARRYQLSRTQWRGIRGTLVGSAAIYSLLYFGSIMAKGMSLGWATPVMNTVLKEHITNDMRFGDAAFKFRGPAGPLYVPYAICWVLTLVVAVVAMVLIGGFVGSHKDWFDMGSTASESQTAKAAIAIVLLVFAGLLLFSAFTTMLWSVYISAEYRTFAKYTRFDGAPFRLDVSTGSVIWLTLGNLLLALLTLGIAWPFIQQRTVRFVVDRLALEGLVDIDRIRQSTATLDRRGEGLADAFDVGGL